MYRHSRSTSVAYASRPSARSSARVSCTDHEWWTPSSRATSFSAPRSPTEHCRGTYRKSPRRSQRVPRVPQNETPPQCTHQPQSSATVRLASLDWSGRSARCVPPCTVLGGGPLEPASLCTSPDRMLAPGVLVGCPRTTARSACRLPVDVSVF
ncbi:hypothetical protein OH77DRAFT_1174191 [Trametes cingulata]|nr:hypothetical protein OH77DRAFT_1174191 [Trametes cingulata]